MSGLSLKEALAAINVLSTGNNQNDAAPVVARVPQGFNGTLNVRIVPGKDFPMAPVHTKCAPRMQVPNRGIPSTTLSDALATKFKEANKAVMSWLTQDQANAQAFLASPVESLMKAGVDLSRAEQKELARLHSAVRAASVLPPGAILDSVKVGAYSSGRVGSVKSGAATQVGRAGNCGCSKGKGN